MLRIKIRQKKVEDISTILGGPLLSLRIWASSTSDKGKSRRRNSLTCVRGPLTRRVVNRAMCMSSRDLRERANRPTPWTDPRKISPLLQNRVGSGPVRPSPKSAPGSELWKENVPATAENYE
ncbi:Uncharacterized protein Fot_22071 [Forsythia ovata]|uniref:Uncharacterized protein n=1 Tax=Forsythia ovata TaxID=205694 RepID=A0ABD1UWN7_9LAMI